MSLMIDLTLILPVNGMFLCVSLRFVWLAPLLFSMLKYIGPHKLSCLDGHVMG